MKPRWSLSVIGPSGPPTLDGARASLGGRAATEPEVGQAVSVFAAGRRVTGIVVFASAGERDVWIGEGRLARIEASECSPAEDTPLPPRLLEVSDRARDYALLREGEAVRYLDRGGREHDGTLVEKCRYGALVGSGSKVLAVSFLRIRRRELDS